MLTLELDEHTVALAAEALRGEADRHRRVAVTVSGELLAERRTTGADIRTKSLHVVETLGEADALGAAAVALTAAWETGKSTSTGRKSRRKSTPPPADAAGSTTDAADDADDEAAAAAALAALGLDDDVDPPRSNGAGETVVEHTDDPDVAAAREALAGPPPAPVIPAP